jgi:hypothetical protein
MWRRTASAEVRLRASRRSASGGPRGVRRKGRGRDVLVRDGRPHDERRLRRASRCNVGRGVEARVPTVGGPARAPRRALFVRGPQRAPRRTSRRRSPPRPPRSAARSRTAAAWVGAAAAWIDAAAAAWIGAAAAAWIGAAAALEVRAPASLASRCPPARGRILKTFETSDRTQRSERRRRSRTARRGRGRNPVRRRARSRAVVPPRAGSVRFRDRELGP